MRLATRTSALWFFGLVMAFLIVLGNANPASASLWGDAYEPNDSQWSAAPVTPPWQSGSIFSYDLEISSVWDKDFFSFYAEEGDSISVSIAAEDEERGVSAELKGPSYSSYLGSASSGFFEGSIWATARETGTHYVEVTQGWWAETPAKYRLTIDAPWHYGGGGGTTSTTTTTEPSTTTATEPPPTTPATELPSFTDVSSGHPYSTAISDLSSRGIISGYRDGTFRPETTVKRAQFAKMIVGTLGLAPTLHEGMSSPFTDLGADSQSSLYPHEYIAAAYANNITKGMSAQSYGPYVEISRAQVITMVVRAAESMHPGSLNDPPGSYSSSWGNFSHTHGANAEMAEYNGLLGGLPLNGSASDPWASMPRGEVAQVLSNLLQLQPDSTPSTTTTTLPPTTTTTTTLPPTTTTTTTLPPTTTTTLPPTTTTTTPKPSITVVKHGFRTGLEDIRQGVYVSAVFGIRNSGAIDTELLFSTVYALDAGGQRILKLTLAIPLPRVLAVGETGYVYSHWYAKAITSPDEVQDVELVYGLYPSSGTLTPVTQLTIDNLQRTTDSWGGLAYEGQVRNTSATTVDGFGAAVVLQSGGKPVTVSRTHVNRVLAPGASYAFTVSVGGPEGMFDDTTVYDSLAWSE